MPSPSGFTALNAIVSAIGGEAVATVWTHTWVWDGSGDKTVTIPDYFTQGSFGRPFHATLAGRHAPAMDL
ncbi:hypothetical protein GCM10011504_02260 [Siccirubricoccus deserti]|nr:hypothetical protein GCM10011504_02260 [Siccirubricoccus deserti]